MRQQTRQSTRQIQTNLFGQHQNGNRKSPSQKFLSIHNRNKTYHFHHFLVPSYATIVLRVNPFQSGCSLCQATLKFIMESVISFISCQFQSYKREKLYKIKGTYIEVMSSDNFGGRDHCQQDVWVFRPLVGL